MRAHLLKRETLCCVGCLTGRGAALRSARSGQANACMGPVPFNDDKSSASSLQPAHCGDRGRRLRFELGYVTDSSMMLLGSPDPFIQHCVVLLNQRLAGSSQTAFFSRCPQSAVHCLHALSPCYSNCHRSKRMQWQNRRPAHGVACTVVWTLSWSDYID